MLLMLVLATARCSATPLVSVRRSVGTDASIQVCLRRVSAKWAACANTERVLILFYTANSMRHLDFEAIASDLPLGLQCARWQCMPAVNSNRRHNTCT